MSAPAAVRVSTYECWVPGFERDGSNWTQTTILAASPGKARYQRYLDLREAGWEVPFQAIRVRSLGARIVLSESREAAFAHTAKSRGLSFAQIGMRVEVEGNAGVIIGTNDSANFDVLFTSGPRAGQKGNCHPRWMMTYFDGDGNESAAPQPFSARELIHGPTGLASNKCWCGWWKAKSRSLCGRYYRRLPADMWRALSQGAQTA